METPDVTPHPPGAHASSNGAASPVIAIDTDTAAEIAAEVKLALRALEDVDMRLMAVQAGTFLVVGLVALLLILEAREARKLK